MIHKAILLVTIFFTLFSCSKEVQKQDDSTIPKSEKWQNEVENTIKLFGHRNWIVVADAAYPKQSNPAIKTITVNTNQLEVIQFVNDLIINSAHVNANIFVDKEMAFVEEKDAKGIENYRKGLKQIVDVTSLKTMLHEEIISELDSSAKVFDVLIIKTNLTIPYTSVFFQLDCGYWNSVAENNLRTILNSKQ